MSFTSGNSSFLLRQCRKNLFYCHGCGRGGDLIRFVELFLDLPFRQRVAHLAAGTDARSRFPSCWSRRPPSISCNSIAIRKRSAIWSSADCTIPPSSKNWASVMLPAETCGAISPPWAIRSICCCDSGLINSQGRDAFCRRVIFPCRQHGQIVNLYGRSIGTAFPHRLLPRSKGGLFAWESVSSFSTVILVEGLFDLAVLWQAGFRNTTCAIGTQLTPAQLAQLADQPAVPSTSSFDQDENQAGQKASHQLAQRLKGARRPRPHRPVATRARSQQLLRCRRHRRRLHRLSEAGTTVMKLVLVYQPATRPALVLIACSTSRTTRSPGPTTFSMPSIFANCRRARCAPTPMTCCTSPAGFRARCSRCPRSPSPRCWTMFVIN